MESAGDGYLVADYVPPLTDLAVPAAVDMPHVAFALHPAVTAISDERDALLDSGGGRSNTR